MGVCMSKQVYRKKAAEAKKTAQARIEKLFFLAEGLGGKDLFMANRYLLMARNLSMKFNVPIPRQYKRRFCKHCYTYLVPGTNCRVRTQKEKVVYSCDHCHKYMRFPYVKEKAKK